MTIIFPARSTQWEKPSRDTNETSSIPGISKPTPTATLNRSTSAARTHVNDDASGDVIASCSQSMDLSKRPLPPGWDMGVAENGRVYFIDHVNAQTTWVSFDFKMCLPADCFRFLLKDTIDHTNFHFIHAWQSTVNQDCKLTLHEKLLSNTAIVTSFMKSYVRTLLPSWYLKVLKKQMEYGVK